MLPQMRDHVVHVGILDLVLAVVDRAAELPAAGVGAPARVLLLLLGLDELLADVGAVVVDHVHLQPVKRDTIKMHRLFDILT